MNLKHLLRSLTNLLKNCPNCGYVSGKSQRSSNQNRYYWSVPVQLISEQTGFSKDEVHELLKRKFLKDIRMVDTKNGYKEIELTKSTTDLDTKQMEDFLSQIRIWASEYLQCFIPEPNENLSGL